MILPQLPIRSAATWIGPDQQQRTDWIHRLSPAEIGELYGAVESVKALGKPMKSITPLDYQLPMLESVIRSWLGELDDGRGFVVVKGVPVNSMLNEDAALAYWLLGLHLGTPKPQNSKGDLLGHVRDTGDDPNKMGTRLYRTRAKQDFHTDGADIIGLLCLQRSKSGGVSRIVSSISVFNEVGHRRPDLVPLLFDDFDWDFEADALPGRPRTFKFPICKYEQGRLRTFYIGWYIRNAQRFPEVPRLSRAQMELLDLIEAIANDPKFYLDMDFEPGDIQWLKNASILHARTEYEDWEDPVKKRHLLRLWLTAEQFKDSDAGLREGIARAHAKP